MMIEILCRLGPFQSPHRMISPGVIMYTLLRHSCLGRHLHVSRVGFRAVVNALAVLVGCIMNLQDHITATGLATSKGYRSKSLAHSAWWDQDDPFNVGNLLHA